MKFPKNRANLYVVVREDTGVDVAILGGFANDEEALDFKDACQQEWIDKVGHTHGVVFDVRLTTFYG